MLDGKSNGRILSAFQIIKSDMTSFQLTPEMMLEVKYKKIVNEEDFKLVTF